MDRRTFLLGATAIAVIPSAAIADCIRNCDPDFPAALRGGAQVVTQHRPRVCLSTQVYDLMTIAVQNGLPVRLQEAEWDYAFWHGGNNAPYDIGTVIMGQCFNHQNVVHGTVIINWFNCIDRVSGRWVRHWSATRPIVDSGNYELVIYYSEYVSGFNDQPPAHQNWPRP